MLDNIQTGKEFFGDVSKPNKTGEKAMKSFGGGFAKIVLVFLVLVGVGFADVPKTEIIATQQVKDYIKNLPQQDQRLVNMAIEVGNKFAALHIGNESFYDEEYEGEWNKKIKPLTTLSGNEWRMIWHESLSDDNVKNKFSRDTCDKGYLKEVLCDSNSVKLQYETLIFGMGNSIFYGNYQFIKLNERLVFELTIGKKTNKVENVKFLTKNSDACSSGRGLELMRKDLKQFESEKPRDRPKYFNELKKSIKEIEEASSICKDY